MVVAVWLGVSCFAQEEKEMTFEDIVFQKALPDTVGHRFELQNPPPPPEDAPTAEEMAAMAEAGEPYFNPQPVALNVRFVGNNVAVIFLNPDGLVTKPPEIVKLIVDGKRPNDDDDAFVFRMEMDDTQTYFFHPRFIRPPLRFRIRLVMERPIEDSDEVRTEIYGFVLLNQLAQEQELEQ